MFYLINLILRTLIWFGYNRLYLIDKAQHKGRMRKKLREKKGAGVLHFKLFDMV
jgi:hypothetical protein